MLYAAGRMQPGNDHPTIREVSPDQAANHPTETDQPAGSAQETRRLGERYTVQEAAEILGTTVDAIRGRVRRGTLDSMKVNGVMYVLLDKTSRDRHTDQPGETSRLDEANWGHSDLLEELRDQVGWLRRKVERKDTIIMSLTQRVPELKPTREAPGARETATPSAPGDVRGGEQAPDGSQESHQEPGKQRSWLYRFFFGP